MKHLKCYFEKLGCKKENAKALEDFVAEAFRLFAEEQSEEKLRIMGVGTFRKQICKSREVLIPNSTKKATVDEHYVFIFKISEPLRKVLRKFKKTTKKTENYSDLPLVEKYGTIKAANQ